MMNKNKNIIPPHPPLKKGGRGGFIFSLLALSLALLSCTSSTIFPNIGPNLSSPIEMSVNSATNRAYLVNSNNQFAYGNASMQVLNLTNPAAPTMVNYVEIANFSGHTYLDAAANYIYLTNRLSNNNFDNEDQILRINIDEASANFLAVEEFADGSNPFGLTYDITTNNLYVAEYESALGYFPLGNPASMNTVALANLSMSDGSTLASSNFRDVAIVGTQAFLSRPSQGLMIVNLTEGHADYYISDFESPRAIVSDGVNLYLVNGETAGDSEVYKLYILNPAIFPPKSGATTVEMVSKDTAGFTTAAVAVGINAQEVVLGTNFIFVSNQDDDTVSVIDRITNAVTNTITVGAQPFGMALYSPGGVDTHLLVANIQSNTVSVIDLGSMSVVGTYQ